MFIYVSIVYLQSPMPPLYVCATQWHMNATRSQSCDVSRGGNVGGGKGMSPCRWRQVNIGDSWGMLVGGRKRSWELVRIDGGQGTKVGPVHIDGGQGMKVEAEEHW